MNFNIEKGISIKSANRDGETTEKFNEIPLSQMVVNDSVFVPNTFMLTNVLRPRVSKYGTNNNMRFTVVKETEGSRIFKIK